jgi:hypothetical protein
VYNEYKKTLPLTEWDWTDESKKNFSAIAKEVLGVLNIITFIIQLFEIRSIFRKYVNKCTIAWDELRQQQKQLFMDLLFIAVTLVIDV